MLIIVYGTDLLGVHLLGSWRMGEVSMVGFQNNMNLERPQKTFQFSPEVPGAEGVRKASFPSLA